MTFSMPHYFNTRAYDVMKGEVVACRGECDSPICPFHIPENIGKLIAEHPPTNYCLRGDSPEKWKDWKP